MKLKQIGVRLEENLIKEAKTYALDNNISLQSIISEALTSYLDNKLSPINPETTQHDNKITSYLDNYEVGEDGLVKDVDPQFFYGEVETYPTEEENRAKADPDDPIEKLIRQQDRFKY